MEPNKTLNGLEKIKAVAIGFIGAGIATQGSMYFQEKSSYNIPRILYPVFEFLGNKGLAIAMILLGLGLIYYGFSKWKSNDGSSKIYGIMAFSSIVLFTGILFFTNKKKSTEEILADGEKKHQEQIDEMLNMEMPRFNNPEIEKHFASFDALYAQYQKSIAIKNTVETEKLDAEFYTVYCLKTAELLKNIKSLENMSEYSLYNGKIITKWQRTKP